MQRNRKSSGIRRETKWDRFWSRFGRKGPKRISKRQQISYQKGPRPVLSTFEKVRKCVLIVIIGLILMLCLMVGSKASHYLSDFKQMGSGSVEIAPAINTGVARNKAMNDYTCIALFGVDSRDNNLKEGQNRSDTIMILSIHNKTGEIKIMSLLRDTYLKVGDDIYGKANSAYSYGGAEGAVSMINENLDLNITEFITVGFTELADTIDALDGLELEISQEEIDAMNHHLKYMDSNIEGESPTFVKIPEDAQKNDKGLFRVHVTGIQAVAYARVRQTAGDDIRRAQRGQTVLFATVRKGLDLVKERDIDKAFNVVKCFMNSCYKSLNEKDLKKLAFLGIKIIINDTFSEDLIKNPPSFPREKNMIRDAMIKGESCVLTTTLKDNIVWLHKYLFEDENYEVSPEALKISDYLRTFYN